MNGSGYKCKCKYKYRILPFASVGNPDIPLTNKIYDCSYQFLRPGSFERSMPVSSSSKIGEKLVIIL